MANINSVTQAIRDSGELSCDDVAQILSTLTCKMKADGFSEVDIDMMDETRDFVCGEMNAELPALRLAA